MSTESRRLPGGEDFLRSALGEQAEGLDPESFSSMLERFIEGGRNAVLGESGSADEAAAAAAFFDRAGRTARRRMADETTPWSRSSFSGSEWAPVLRAIDEHRSSLFEVPGVLGFGPGFRRRAGTRDHVRCLLIFVRKKLPEAELETMGRDPLPNELVNSDGVSVPTDVLELRRLRRYGGASAAVASSQHGEWGTVGAFGVDLVTNTRVAFTAMHVMGLDRPPPDPVEVVVRATDGSSERFGTLSRGTMVDVDAATIALASPEPWHNTLPGIGRIRGWRPVDLSSDYDRAVRLFGAKTAKVRQGVIVEPMIHLPQYDLDSALLVDIQAQAGDSGAALVDEENLLLGFLVGRADVLDGLRVFSPASLVLKILSSDLIVEASDG